MTMIIFDTPWMQLLPEIEKKRLKVQNFNLDRQATQHQEIHHYHKL